jgi:aryl-alcohol dehydrogenase (NADP+)
MLDETASRPFFKQALDLGINFFDTADVYSLGASEEVTGRALRDLARRDQVVVATKVYNPMGDGPNDRGLSRKHIMDAIDASLRRLGMDHVDLYQIHRWDSETPIEETLEALNDVVRAGQARYIGASSMYAWQFAQALALSDSRGWARFATMQNHYNLVYREEEREMIPLCRAEGVGIIPWSPLARGFLAGTRRPEFADKAEAEKRNDASERAKGDDFARQLYFRPGDFKTADAVVALAEKRGVKPAQIALAWMLHKPGITAPIVGASKLYQLDEAVAAREIKLDEEEIAALEAAYEPHPVLGH